LHWTVERLAGQRRGDLGDLVVGTLAVVARQRCDPRVLGDLEDRGADLVSQLVADGVAQPALATEVDDLVRRAESVRTKISIVSISSPGTCSRAHCTTVT
jgi:hypothetical protein